MSVRFALPHPPLGYYETLEFGSGGGAGVCGQTFYYPGLEQ